MLGGGGSGRKVSAAGLSGFPVAGEEIVEAVHNMIADAVKDADEVREPVDIESFAESDKLSQEDSGSRADIWRSEKLDGF